MLYVLKYLCDNGDDGGVVGVYDDGEYQLAVVYSLAVPPEFPGLDLDIADN